MNNTAFAVIAIVSALALFGVVMVTVAITMQLQQAEAVPPSHAKCPPSGVAFNASQGRCFHP